MTLNKYRSKRIKYTYNGHKIIKKGTQELYSLVYERVWDLTQYDRATLRKYGLSKAIYVYVGSTSRYNLIDRCSDWRCKISNNATTVAKHIREFIQDLKTFYILETTLTATEIDQLLYYNAKVVARAESVQGARELERGYTTQYHHLDLWGDTLDTQYILLSKVASKLKEVSKDGITVIKAK